ncbi:MAG TPA: hypothetical protein VEQ37_19330 [Actinomycetota bacterium]|nr:hypothetical protein [Actinomycetota bacterium]
MPDSVIKRAMELQVTLDLSAEILVVRRLDAIEERLEVVEVVR